MNITIDISPAVNGAAGLGRYASALVEAMLPYEQPKVFYNRIQGRSQTPPALAHLPAHTVKRGYKNWRSWVFAGQLTGMAFDSFIPDTDIFHATEHLLMPLEHVKTVLTVHDLIFKLYPQHHKRLNYWYLNLAMPLYVKRADAIIAISEATRRDLIEHYHTPPEKITVIYEAAAPHFQPATAEQIAAVRQKYQLPEQFLLVVGTIEPRKNYTRLLEALALLREQYRQLALVVVGSRGWLYEPFLQRIAELKAENWVVFPGYVPDDELSALYGAARLLVMPSVYEGFGLPILEAMACGTAVASSNAASLPELGGDVAAYFDPYSVEDMAATISRLLADDLRREMMRQAGVKRAALFSWDRAAQETLALYKRLG